VNILFAKCSVHIRRSGEVATLCFHIGIAVDGKKDEGKIKCIMARVACYGRSLGDAR